MIDPLETSTTILSNPAYIYPSISYYENSYGICIDCKGPLIDPQSVSNEYWFCDDGVRCKKCFDASKNNTHRHDWKEYIGFTDKYRYCECGAKKRD